MNILIVGATGAVGHALLMQALGHPKVHQVTVLARKPLPEAFASHPPTGLSWQQIDFDQLEQQASNVCAQQVFCCLGTTIKQAGSKQAFEQVDLGLPVVLAQGVADNVEAKHLHVVSAQGANASSRIFYNQVKGKMEQQVEKIMPGCVTFYRPSLINSERETKRLGEHIANGLMGWLRPLIPAAYKPILAEQIAGAMLQQALAYEDGQAVVSHLFNQSMLNSQRS